jgi:hypothetical protein
MFENCHPSRSLLRRIAVAASAVALAAVPYAAQAQTDTSTSESGYQSSNSANYSSSLDWKSYLSTDGFNGNGLGGSPSPSPQYGQSSNNRYPDSTSRWSHLAFEAGAGFTAPIGNDVRDGYDTWGYNIAAGAGWNFSKRFGALIEYQFNRNKIPGATLAAIGAPGGNINTWSFTIDPIFYQPITPKFGAYVTGGGGFYRKVTNFTAPEEVEFCSFFCEIGTENVTIGHFSSNQGGLNIGAGLYWKAFGEDSRSKLYAEARYVWVDSPAATATTNGEGSEGLIPVTFGIRF